MIFYGIHLLFANSRGKFWLFNYFADFFAFSETDNIYYNHCISEHNGNSAQYKRYFAQRSHNVILLLSYFHIHYKVITLYL